MFTYMYTHIYCSVYKLDQILYSTEFPFKTPLTLLSKKEVEGVSRSMYKYINISMRTNIQNIVQQRLSPFHRTLHATYMPRFPAQNTATSTYEYINTHMHTYMQTGIPNT